MALAGQSPSDATATQTSEIAIETGVMTAEGKAIAEIATAIVIAVERTRDALLLNRGVTGPRGERWPRVGAVPVRSAPATSAPAACRAVHLLGAHQGLSVGS